MERGTALMTGAAPIAWEGTLLLDALRTALRQGLRAGPAHVVPLRPVAVSLVPYRLYQFGQPRETSAYPRVLRRFCPDPHGLDLYDSIT